MRSAPVRRAQGAAVDLIPTLAAVCPLAGKPQFRPETSAGGCQRQDRTSGQARRGPGKRRVRRWPGLRGRDLIILALCSARNGQSGPDGWPRGRVLDYSACGDTGALAIHPHDRLVLLGGVDAVRKPPDGVDAVVSLCRLGSAEAPAPGVDPADHVEAWLTDSAGPGGNPNLDLVLAQAADTVAALRAEGRTVLVHCTDAVSRTPAVAALYAARNLDIPVHEALRDVRAVLPAAQPSPAFMAALDRLGEAASAPQK